MSNLKKIVSLHLPKSSGTSIYKGLCSVLGSENVLLDNKDDPADPLAQYIIDPSTWKNRCKNTAIGQMAVHGHFRAEKYWNIPNAVFFTFIRHPVENIISIYRFWSGFKEPTSNLHKYFIDNNLDVLEMAQLPLLKYLYSKTYFGEIDIACFDYVGIYEEREKSFLHLQDILGLPIDFDIYENRTENFGVNEIENIDVTKEKLKEILKVDIEFYDYCKKIFQK